MRPDLGVRFEEAVAGAVRKAVAHPEHGAPRTKNARRRLVSGFPFGVICKTEADGIVVIAIAYGRRKPEHWAEWVK